MSASSAVVCREIFDENSQPSAEEISEYAQQLGIDPESESHLLPLARDGLMQALPSPWKAYMDEKLQTHYYYNEDTKKTQWEHPLDHVYRDLVKRARDASMHDDTTCASVQELLISEENTKHLERVETKVESDDELSTDSGENQTDLKDTTSTLMSKRLSLMGRPPLAPLARLDKKLGDLRISPLRRSADNPVTKPTLMRNTSDRDLLSRPTSFERPKMLFKQQSEIIDLKMHVLNSPEEDNFSSLLTSAKVDRGLFLTGKGSMFLKLSKSDLPSPDNEKSLPLDSVTKSDPPKGILREKLTDSFHRKVEIVALGRSRHADSLDEDRKSVRFKLENLPEPTISPGSDSSEQNEGHSIISAPAASFPSPLIPSSPILSPSVVLNSLNPLKLSSLSSPVPLYPLNPITPPPVPSFPITPSIVLSPLVTRPPLPPKPVDSPRESKSVSGSDKESLESDRGTSPKRRVLRPPAADYIKPDLFQKNFQKISDLVRPGDIEPASLSVHVEDFLQDKEVRPRSPMIPQQKNKISINLMESIESETSIDSPDKEFANLDLNDLDDSNNMQAEKKELGFGKEDENESLESDDCSDKASNIKTSPSSLNKSSCLVDNISIPQVKVPKLDLSPKTKILHSNFEEFTKNEESNRTSRSESIEIKSPQLKVSPTPSFASDLKSPRYDSNKPWSSPFSSFKPLNKAVIAPLKSSDSDTFLGKGLTSPRLDGVIISQGKSNTDNVVVVYQFEQDETFPKPVRSPLIPDMGREMLERNKGDERRRLELSVQKELESIRVEFTAKERRLRAELQEELKTAEEKFLMEKRVRLKEQEERHRREMEEALVASERSHQEALQSLAIEAEEARRRHTEAIEDQHEQQMARLRDECRSKLVERREQLEIENERALSELREQLQTNLNAERVRLSEANRATVESLRDEHTSRVNDLRHDYRAEVERLRTQHACHLEELRARLASSRVTTKVDDRALQDKYKCLKEKYARLKHDVKMSIERRNKRREMSMTTGSETEKSNSHKATQSLERCKELNETSVSAVIEPEPRARVNNNPTIKYNDNETSLSESNAQSNAHRSSDNNNDDWRLRRNTSPPANQTQPTVTKRPHRRAAVAFREPPARARDRDRDRDAAATTDYQDSSDATTADEKVKEPINGHGRRRCFTRLKSASTSRLNYSPKRGEGWSSPLESLRQQLRKLDDLEDQFPDLACQPAYSLRYPFTELGAVTRADAPELEFVRHRALIEREGMRRARAVLKRRRAALRETGDVSPQRAPSEEREATELEVALHRARALLGEKEIRLRHIERALRRIADSHPPPHLIQETVTSDASSDSEAAGEPRATGAVLRSLRALHADVRDIWRALDVRARTTSPETSSCNAPSTSHTRMTLSAPDPMIQDNSDGGVAERARALRAWLQTAP